LEDGYLCSPSQEQRWHVAIDPKTGAALEPNLFMTAGLDLNQKQEFPDSSDTIEIAARIRGGEEYGEILRQLDTWHPFGGERRLIHWSAMYGQGEGAWKCPDSLAMRLKVCQRLRMVLVTPAVFKKGWMPGWVDEPHLVGFPVGTKLSLRSACVGRWLPISGWDLASKPPGPKSIRRLVPAGSVYFLKIENAPDWDAAAFVREHWLESVADCAQDKKDGFGLAVWGTWDYAPGE
jgi:CRISPR-associated protein Cmr3